MAGSKTAPPPLPPAPAKPKTLLKSDSVLAGGFKAAGLCRTTNGWAAAVLELDGEGKIVSLKLGPSETFPEHIARKMVKTQMQINQETLKRFPWRPGSW